MRAGSQSSEKLYSPVLAVRNRDCEGVGPDINPGGSGKDWRGRDDDIGRVAEPSQIFNAPGGTLRVIEVDNDHLVGGRTSGMQGAHRNHVQLLPAQQRAVYPVGASEVLTLENRSKGGFSRGRE